MIALGKAISDGERNFSTIVAVDGESKKMFPCFNCRQLFNDYMSNGYVIIEENHHLKKIEIKKLIPFPYQVKFKYFYTIFDVNKFIRL